MYILHVAFLWFNRMYFDKNGEIDSLPDILAGSAPAAPVAQALTQVPDEQAGIQRMKTKKKSCLKAISFPVLNEENDDASVVSHEQQYAAFKTDNDIDIDFEVDNGDVDDDVDPEEDDSSREDKAPSRRIIDGHTRSGRSFKNLQSIDKPTRSSQYRGRKDDHKVRKEALLAQLAKRLTPAEIKFYNSMKDLKELSLLSAEILSDEGRYVETALVGAAGNKFGNTADLNMLNYKQSMEILYRNRYVEGIDEEQYKMSHNEIFEEVHVDDIPPGTKLLDSTWANKLRADGLTRCRLAIRGFQQIDGVHFDASDKAAPVVCDVTIREILILAIIANWLAWIVNVEGVFLQGRFQNGEQIFMKIPDGFQMFYPSYGMLKLLQTLYGLAQSAIQFWRECRMAMDAMNMAKNVVDPCLVLWVNDFLILGPDELVPGFKDELLSLFNCKDVGKMNEYVGCRVERDCEAGWMQLTQPVKIQKFVDEYGFDIVSNRIPSTPAEQSWALC
jgi:hypothetical protein